jgi:hypothetical protein
MASKSSVETCGFPAGFPQHDRQEKNAFIGDFARYFVFASFSVLTRFPLGFPSIIFAITHSRPATIRAPSGVGSHSPDARLAMAWAMPALGKALACVAVLGVAVAGPQVYLLYNAPTDALVLL